jgi:citrate lyase subunit beta / citryl-CoA lyase
MRSMLFTPALRPDRAKKSWQYQPGAVIVDLEDTVPKEQKGEARVLAKETVASTKQNWYVRINPIHTSYWQQDVDTVLHENLSGIVIPKVEEAVEVSTFLEGIKGWDLHINITIETVKGLSNLRSILAATDKIRSVTFGEGDFCLDLGIDWDSANPLLLIAKTQVAFESRLAGIDAPHDGVYATLNDDDGLRESVYRAKKLGFTCKHCIHPSQIAIIEECLSPSSVQVEKAKEIVTRFQELEKEGIASFQIDGQFVDYPVYYRALQLLKGVES